MKIYHDKYILLICTRNMFHLLTDSNILFRSNLLQVAKFQNLDGKNKILPSSFIYRVLPSCLNLLLCPAIKESYLSMENNFKVTDCELN